LNILDPLESGGERILKIRLRLPKLGSKVKCIVFLRHTVHQSIVGL